MKTLARFEDPERDVGLVFFAQRLMELTHELSLDSFKAPAINAPFLVREALAQLNKSKDEQIGAASHIIDELQQKIAENPVVRSLVGNERDLSRSLATTDYRQLRSLLKVLRTELAPPAYIVKTFDLIDPAIKSKEKKRIEYLLREIVTTLQNAGMSRRHIHRKTRKYWFDLSPRKEKLNCGHAKKFLASIFPYDHQFEVFFKASVILENLSKDSFKAFGIEVCDELDEDFKLAKGAKAFLKKKTKEKFVKVRGFSGFDRYSALENARERFHLLQNHFRVYHHRRGFSISKHAMIKQCCEDEIVVVAGSDQFMLHMADDHPSSAAENLDFILRESKIVRGVDRQRFLSVVGFHGLGLDSESLENQVINLWIGLETISPGESDKAKVDSVVKAALPVIGLRYFEGLVRQAFELVNENKSVDCDAIFGSTEFSFESGDRLLNVLHSPNLQAERKDLFEHLKGDELTKFRLYQLHQKTVNPDAVIETLESHQQRVEWQLRRIYRTRNAIVHSGKRPAYTHYIIDSAHFYLDQMIRMVGAVSSGPAGFDSFENIFNYLGLEFTSYQRRFRRADKAEFDLASVFWRRPILPKPDDVIDRS